MTTIRERTTLRQTNSQAILVKNFGSLAYGLSPDVTPIIGSTVERHPEQPALINYGGSPDTLVGIVTNSDALGPFINAPTDMLGQLTPKLRFSFSSADENGKAHEEIFTFSDHTDSERAKQIGIAKLSPERTLQDFLGDGTTVGTDVGVQEFRWVWDNKHSGDRTIKAGLTLYFGSTAELLNHQFLRFIFMTKDLPSMNKRPNKKPNKTKKAMEDDLRKRFRILASANPGTAAPTPGQTVSQTLRQLKVAVGWSVPQDIKRKHAGWKSADYQKFTDGVAETQKVIALQLISYELNFGQEGQVTLSLEYVGSLDANYSDDNNSNIFGGHRDDGNTPADNIPIQLANQIPYEEGMLNPFGIFNGADQVYCNKGGDAGASFRTESPAFRLGGGSDPYGGVIYGRFKKLLSSRGWTALNDEEATIEVTLRELEYEKETLKILINYLQQYHDQDSQRVEAAEQGLAAVSEAISSVQSKLRSDLYGKFIENLFQLNRVFYYQVGRGTVDASETPAAQSADTEEDLERIKPSPEDHAKHDKAKQEFLQKGFSRSWLETAKPDLFEAMVRVEAYTAKARRRNTRRKSAQEDPTSYRRAVNRFKESIELDDQRRQSDNKEFKDNHATPLDPTTAVGRAGAGKDAVLYYMRLGDIVGAALTGVRRVPGFDSDVLMGSFVPSDWGSAGVRPNQSYPLASLPISIEYFNQWFINEISSKNITRMSFRAFVDRLLNKLVAPVVNQTVLKDENRKKLTFDMTTVTSQYKPIFSRRPGPVGIGVQPTAGSRADYIPTARILQKIFPSRKRRLGPPDDIENANNYYFVITADQLDPERNGQKEGDEGEGIYHLVLGSDRGLVKTYSFAQKKVPFLKAMHIEDNSTGMALVLPQDVELTMVGNCIFRNGNIIYINTDFAFGRSVGRQLGLGGYYKVVKSDNVIRSGKFETRLTCMFERYADTE